MKPSIVRGWDIPSREFLDAHRKNRLLSLSLDLTDACGLECDGCFTRQERMKRLLDGVKDRDLGYYKALISEAKSLGVRTVDFVGAGEPMLDPNFYRILGFLRKEGIAPVVFTNGLRVCKDSARRLFEGRASVFIKLWSLDNELQDRYTVAGYTEKRDRALDVLIREGFSKGRETVLDGIAYKTTMIGADILVRKSNYYEIPDIFRYCRGKNIMPEIKCFIPVGSSPEDEISAKEYLALRKELKVIDKEEFGIEMPATFYPQACDCKQSVAGLYVMLSGDVKGCVGTKTVLGSCDTGVGLIDALRARKERVGFGCIPRLEYQKAKGDCPGEMAKLYNK